MPGMSGRVLAERVKERQPAIKVLFTTGYSRGTALVDDAGIGARRCFASLSPSSNWQ